MKNVHFLSSRRLGLAWVMATLAAVLPLQALSQVYPAKPVKVLVGFTAGGAVDLIARSVGQVMSAGLGQPVVVENKPGAGTNIAMKALIDAPPDGYTLMLTANSIAANPALVQARAVRPRKRRGAGGAGRARAGGHRGECRVALHQRGPADPGRQGQAEHHRVRVAGQWCHPAHGHGVLHARGRR
jgi:hypothetical protein